tara:strand:+ start:470 stop:829 length:360 start_codon:yes stop_codon:yes gene_type:complete
MPVRFESQLHILVPHDALNRFCLNSRQSQPSFTGVAQSVKINSLIPLVTNLQKAGLLGQHLLLRFVFLYISKPESRNCFDVFTDHSCHGIKPRHSKPWTCQGSVCNVSPQFSRKCFVID